MHLLYVPDTRGSVFFLWGTSSITDGSSLVRQLKRRGRRATATVVDASLRVVDAHGYAIPLTAALPLLASCDIRVPSEGASVAAWVHATKTALRLIARGRVVPCCEQVDAHEGVARWRVRLDDARDASHVQTLALALPYAAFAHPVAGVPPRMGSRVTVHAAMTVLQHFLDAAVDVMMRSAAAGERRGSRVAARMQMPAWGTRWVTALTAGQGRFAVDVPGGVPPFEAFTRWSTAATVPMDDARYQLRLDLPREGERFPLEVCIVGGDTGDRLDEEEGTSSLADNASRLSLVRALEVAGRLFPPLHDADRAADDTEGVVGHTSRAAVTLMLDAPSAWAFMTEGASVLTAAGFQVLIPSVFARAGERTLRLRMRLGTTPSLSRSVGKRTGTRLGDVCHFRWEAAIGDDTLTDDELRALAASQTPLVALRGGWVVAEPRHVRAVQALVGTEGTLSVAEALRAALTDEPARKPEDAVASGLPLDVRRSGVVDDLLARLTDMDAVTVDTSALVGTLRPYQERGVRWLATLGGLGLGGCLADDMGLGKTVQLLGLLLHVHRDAKMDGGDGAPRPSLIVCPTSVVGNWLHEAARFAPSLHVIAHTGADRGTTAGQLAQRAAGGVVVTTYAILRRDATLLRELEWRVLVLDEAQHVKNASSGVSVAARTLRAGQRFALTGTPVENRLADLWAILDVTTPKLLGSAAAFQRDIATPIEQRGDPLATERLRRLVAPFVLRRVKSDPVIAAELPPKQESEVFCTLTREQAALYQAALDDAMRTIETSAGMTRKGAVLALVTSLKQICNHPSQYLGDAAPLDGRSGKLARLGEMLEEAVAEGDRALVFTQFRAMAERLAPYLEARLGCPVLLLHGGTRSETRTALVERFQAEGEGPMVFILSLKAGGTGLNLTAASHVFHFDRWWNPAVEDQATDRAYRIGQTRPVQVYKLVTAGTIEERIAEMLHAKRGLARRVVGSGEQWITELSDGELRELFGLGVAGVDEGVDEA